MKLLPAKEKKERALGTKLDLKAFRSQSPKSAMVRRPQRPGVHGKRPVRGFSEFKQQLMEKQKMKISYGLTETQLEKIFRKASSGKKNMIASVVEQLESRLDNVVYRIGLAPSRIMARQIVGHGLIEVNGRKVTVPSYVVRPGDEISVKEAKRNSPLFKDLPNTLKSRQKAGWYDIDVQKFLGKVTATPEVIELPFNINMVVDYYSR
jgi:small subunit ribosomal protein S4